jgi:23S rRNA pseudouridine2605 synthase
MSTEQPRKPLSLKREARQTATIEERLQKVLANAGLGSRRSLEERIQAGEVRVNGVAAEIGQSVRAGDRVELDGKGFVAVAAEPEDAEVLIYHKPDGVVTTHDDPEGRPTVFERLPRLDGARWVSVGRLDYNTSGLLLLTSDGELANALMHPSSEIQREYVCRIHGPVDDEMLERLRNGVELEDGPARFDELAVISRGESHSWFRVMLREGRNREVRRMWESQGVTVSRLKRIRYGSIELPRELRRGHTMPLPREKYLELRRSVGLPEQLQTLTLQPVIGVRRAQRNNEFRPAERSQRAWNNAQQDEARELRAFDFVREDTRPGNARKRRRNKKGGPNPQAQPRGPRPFGQGHGQGQGQPGAPGKRPNKRRGPKPGQPWSGNPAERQSWSPGGRGPGGGPRGPGGGGPRAPGGGGTRGPGGPGARGPGGRGPDRPRKPHRNPAAGATTMPYGFPSDHAYAQREMHHAQQDGRPPRRPGGGRRGPRPPR